MVIGTLCTLLLITSGRKKSEFLTVKSEQVHDLTQKQVCSRAIPAPNSMLIVCTHENLAAAIIRPQKEKEIFFF